MLAEYQLSQKRIKEDTVVKKETLNVINATIFVGQQMVVSVRNAIKEINLIFQNKMGYTIVVAIWM